MTEDAKTSEAAAEAAAEPPVVTLTVAPAPHVAGMALTTRRMMLDVLIALVPATGMALYVFGFYAARQVFVCVLTCVAAEGIFTAARRRPLTLKDLSAVVTGMILGLSLPWSAPWYVGVIGSVTAIGIAKVIFGGVGQNIFNPGMVGRAFVMICFAKAMGASAYVPGEGVDVISGYVSAGGLDVISGATPLTAARQAAAPGLWPMFIGITNGSLGEISALACILGGLYLCIRRTASWEIPAGMIGAVVVIAGAMNIADPQINLTVFHHLTGGALLFGAFFIATDPVTSPLTPKGKLIFGAGIGALVMLIRVFSGYPEGVMFAVLVMNAMVPLINRWTIPKPVGGPVPQKE